MEKERDAFVSAPRTKDGLRGSCKACHAKNMRERYATVPGVKERLRETVNTWRKNNRERRNETCRARRLRDEDSYRKHLLSRLRRACRHEDIAFDLEMDDLLIPEYCPVLGIPIEINRVKGTRPDGTPSVDRVVPALGYVKGNVRIISSRANRMKDNASLEELRALVRYVEEHLARH